MKQISKKSGNLFLVILIIFFVGACSSSRKAAKGKLPKGEEVVKIFCSGPDYQTDKNHFRANSVGESIDQAISKKKALNNARTDLASSIQVLISSVLHNYVNSREMNNTEIAEEKLQAMSREITDQELRGTRIICEKVARTKDGKYKTYLAIELVSDDLLDAMNKRLSEDSQLKIDYDYEKFKKEFEKSIEEYRQQNKQ